MLYPGADLVQRGEAELDDVEGVRRTCCAAQQLRAQRGRVPAERVERGDGDAVPPLLVPFRQPVRVESFRCGRRARPTAGVAGRASRRRRRWHTWSPSSRSRPGTCVRPPRPRSPRPAAPGPPPAAFRTPRPRSTPSTSPPNSAATAAVDRLHRPTCSHAHRRARSVSTARGAIWWMRLRPAAHRALLLRAPPQPLAPHQRDRPAPRRQIPHQHRAAALRLGHHPALRAALDPGPQLDQQFDLPADLPRGQHLKIGKTHKDSARPRPLATLTYQLGPPPIRSFSLRIVKAPASSQPQAQDRVARSKPLIIVKTPITGY